MKKRYLLLLLIVILMAGCQTNKKVPEEQNKISIKLSNNSSAGESWEYFITNDELVEISKSFGRGGCPDDVDGCGGYDVYKVKALKEGTTTITFNHIDSDHNVFEEAVYEIIIDDNLNIVTNESGSYFKE